MSLININNRKNFVFVATEQKKRKGREKMIDATINLSRERKI